MFTNRRMLLKAGIAAPLLLAGYAVAAPLLRLNVARYHIEPSQWPQDFDLKIAVLSDIHALNPWMSAARIRQIAEETNRLAPDIVLLAGDYHAGMPRYKVGSYVSMDDCADALSVLRAPLGVHAVLGNHDVSWNGGDDVRKAFPARGINVMENMSLRLTRHGRPFWLSGLGDQWGNSRREGGRIAMDDLPGTLKQISDDAPAILLAHEPDIFVNVPSRYALTICGHTHGGQVSLPGYGPVRVPSRYGRRFAYGHIVEGGRHLVVSGGLGMSGIPIRFGVPPEIVLITLGGAKSTA